MPTNGDNTFTYKKLNLYNEKSSDVENNFAENAFKDNFKNLIDGGSGSSFELV